MENKKIDKNKVIGLVILLCLVIVGGAYAIGSSFNNKSSNSNVGSSQKDIKKVTMVLEQKGEILEGSEAEIKIPVKLSGIPAKTFPAASMSVSFEKDKLEFIGIEKGTIENYLGEVPEWKIDVKASNKLGTVNAIYLDKSGSKNSYCKSGFKPKTKDVVLYLKFKLTKEAKVKDLINLKIDDAVFATVKGDSDNTSLSTSNGNMAVKNLILEVE